MSLRKIEPIVSIERDYMDFRIVANDYGEAKDEIILIHKKGKIEPIVIQVSPCARLTYDALKKHLESGPTRYEIVSSKEIIEQANLTLEEMRDRENYSSYKERFVRQSRPRSPLD